MPERTSSNQLPLPQSLHAEQLTAQTTKWLSQKPDTPPRPNPLAGQTRALSALQQALRSKSSFSHAYMALPAGLIAEDIIAAVAAEQDWPIRSRYDWVYLANPQDGNAPLCIWLPAGLAESAIKELWCLLESPVADRSAHLEAMKRTYASAPFVQYLEQVKTLGFDDLPGNELANIIVSHTQEGKSWVYCDRVTPERLFGDIRLQSIEGTISTELHLIRPGALLKANGATLIIDASELLLEPKLWRELKHVLKQQSYDWPQPGEGKSAIFYEPEPVPLDLKVILTGPAGLFNQLDELDADFTNLFPYFADFSAQFLPAKTPVSEYFGYLAYLEQRAKHRPLDESGLDTLLKLSSSLCEHQDELSLDSVRLVQLLEEADSIASEAGAAEIAANHLTQADFLQRFRGARLAEMSWQNILETQIQIDTAGEVIGQINGLTVVTMGGAEFGEPSRITATVHYGDGDIIDIERKAELSGSIHTKGVMILTAYLANLFAQHEPMPLSATLVFEQSYHEVDGDSASLAELCCLLSALSEVPIKQNVAVTGAIDQFGNVQAIGGINEKIVGYFEICHARGLDGTHRVIVPESNRSNLHLPQRVIDAVAAKKFHVIPVRHVSQAIELLMGLPCGAPDAVNDHSIFGRIQSRLKELHNQDLEKASFLQRLRKRLVGS
ncbi:MAG: AAA family ATPase [Idiomarina sp.]|nr:AAA family ATPase [Idiomarina sp.]